MTEHVLKSAKAYAALVGAVAAALVAAIPPHTPFWTVLSLVVAVAGAVTTYVVPNADNSDPAPGED